MKILVIGLGSMGKRRINLLKNNVPNNNDFEIFGVDTSLERRASAQEQFGIKAFSSLNEALSGNQYSCAFVCSAPLTHYDIIMKCLKHGLHVFTELNVVADGYSEMQTLSKEKGLVLFLSSTLNYRKDIQYIQKRINEQKKPLDYLYHVGQYLPDWHPWENYKSFFVNEKRTNGCREIFAVDLPWLVRTFGEVVDVYSCKDNMSKLEINYPDNYFIVVRHKNGHKGMFCVDVVSRKPARRLEIFSEDLHILWDGRPDSLIEYDLASKQSLNISSYESVQKDKNYCESIIEDAYLDEILTFFNVMKGTSTALYSMKDDEYVLGLIDKIEGQ